MHARMTNRPLLNNLGRAAVAMSLVLGVFDMNASEATLPALKLVTSQRPLVIAHRGYCQFAPENTLPSFKLAMAAGADLVELDYYHSKDGKLVVIHDATLDRTTDATNRWRQQKIKVEAKTAAELQSLDAGSWFDRNYAGTKIPLLAEALDTIQQGGVTLIERKAGAPADCVKLLRQKDLVNKLVVQSFDWEYLRAYHDGGARASARGTRATESVVGRQEARRDSERTQRRVAGRAAEDRSEGCGVERQGFQGGGATCASTRLEGLGLYD